MAGSVADAVVIGAGVMGASIAFHLARAGLGRVAVLDRGAPAGASTGQSGAIVRMHYTNAPETRLALASLAYFHHWGDLVGGHDADPGFRRVGFAMLVGPENADRLRRAVAMHQALGVATRVVAPDELRASSRASSPTTWRWPPTSRTAATPTRWRRRGPSWRRLGRAGRPSRPTRR
jgi:sarcosine oxidase, subunit beta